MALAVLASSPVWASETGLARTRERAAKRVLASLASLAQIGELARRLIWLFRVLHPGKADRQRKSTGKALV